MASSTLFANYVFMPSAPPPPTRRYTTTSVRVGCKTVTLHPDGAGSCVVRMGKREQTVSVAALKDIAQALVAAAADCEAELPKPVEPVEPPAVDSSEAGR